MLFRSVSGTASALGAALPVISAIFVGTVAAVGGGVLVSVMKDNVPAILVASAPRALLVSGVYAATAVASGRAAAAAGIATAIASSYLVRLLGLRTRRADSAGALLLTRSEPGDEPS